FIPVDQSVPEYTSSDLLVMSGADESMTNMIKDACYDCHSYESEYPGYANVAPLSLWIQGHIDHGRGEMNFSTWGEMSNEDQQHLLKEAAEKVEKKEMPLTPFLITHAEARITEDQRAEMAAWFRSKMN
ncbi:MAG: hypothetical protein ACI9P8_000668, partial [Bacteroidia bacterium]